ncbi:Solute carrier family 35 member F4 [Trichoplax sp. H2]|nr:Solute carrier family 35 member F4 [Trichoplax sp. H2]|eukprot:RDD37187.1 Solute carrier family 35 member F4 [Trichoplax sp. H2]
MDNCSINSYEMAIESLNKVSTDDDEEGKSTFSELTIRKTIYGIIIILGTAISFSLINQFGQLTVSSESNFTSITLFTWIATSTNSLVFPLYAILLMIFKGENFGQIYRESIKIYPRKDIKKTFWLRFLPLAILLNIVITLNFYPLNFTTPTNVTAVFSSVLAMVYILSIIFLKEPLILLRALAVCLSTGGIILFAYDDGFGSFAALGVILSTMFAFSAACFRVYEKFFIGDASSVQGAMLLTIIGIINLLLGWISVIIFHYTGIENLVWSQIPWEPLMITNILNVLYSCCIVIGVAVTYPVFVSLGSLFGIPINAVIDAIVLKESFSVLKIFGTILLIAGFVILLIPLEKAKSISKKIINVLICRY